MEYKDIINLFVPIIFNGIILFLFQKVMDEKFKKSSAKDELKKKIYKGYFKKLRSINKFIHVTMENEFFNPLEVAGIEEIPRELFDEYMLKLKAKCNELNAYYMANKAFLGKEKKIKNKHKELITHIDEYMKVKDIVECYNGVSDAIEELTKNMVKSLLK